MRLTELNPRWFSDPGRRGQGVTFDCPHCAGGVRLAAALANPLDGGTPISLASGILHWTRDGDTFDTLTLTPSIDASASGHWHGWVKGGEVTNA